MASPSLPARVGLALGLVAMVVLPIAYMWAFRPSTRPAGADALIPVVEVLGILAAGAALLLGRRARGIGDRSSAAIWAPRLGAGAIVGYALTVVMTMSPA